MRLLLKTLAILIAVFPAYCWSSTEINLARSQLATLAEALQSAPVEQQHEFSRIALSQLYTTYQQELKRSRNDKPTQTKKILKLNRWRNATISYLQEIDAALSHVLIGGDYQFFVNKQGRILFSVADLTLMVTGPNHKAENQLESNIINQFCDLFDCQAYLSKAEEKYFEYSLPVIKGQWLMDRRHKADFYTNNGIIFRFSSLENRKAKQNWSVRLTQDLLFLVKTLKLSRDKGFNIDIAAVSLTSSNIKNGDSKITINQAGDFIYVNLPVLGSNNDILERLRPLLIEDNLKNANINQAIILYSDKYYKQS